jgi:hypothetical protein
MPTAIPGLSLRWQAWSMEDFVFSAPKKRQESPSKECLGSREQPERVCLSAPGTSHPMTGDPAGLVGTDQAMR